MVKNASHAAYCSKLSPCLKNTKPKIRSFIGGQGVGMLQEMQRKAKMSCKPSVLTTKRHWERENTSFFPLLFLMVRLGWLCVLVPHTWRASFCRSCILQPHCGLCNAERLGIARALHRTWSHVLKGNAGSPGISHFSRSVRLCVCVKSRCHFSESQNWGPTK